MTPENEVQASPELQNGSKEIGEVFDAIGGLIDSAKAGENIGEVLMGNFQKLTKAFEDYAKIPEEIKNKSVAYPTVGYHFGKLIAKF